MPGVTPENILMLRFTGILFLVQFHVAGRERLAFPPYIFVLQLFSPLSRAWCFSCNFLPLPSLHAGNMETRSQKSFKPKIRHRLLLKIHVSSNVYLDMNTWTLY